MNDQVLVSELHGSADLAKKLEALQRVQTVKVAIAIDCLAFNVLHNKIRETIVRSATVKQPGDVWVFKLGKDLTFHYEPAQDCVSIHAPIHELNGNFFTILVVGSHRQKYGPHSTTANLAEDFVRPNALSDTFVMVSAFNLINSSNHPCIHDSRRNEKRTCVVV